MDHHPHIGLVDTHTEGVGGHHHPYLVFLPVALSLVLHSGIEAGVIEGGADACLIKQLCHFLGATTTAGIDDGAAFHAIKDMDELFALVGGLTDDIRQVLALEAHFEDGELLRKVERGKRKEITISGRFCGRSILFPLSTFLFPL